MSENGSIAKHLIDIVEALAPLAPEERQRTIEAALMFLGESVAPTKPKATKKYNKRGPSADGLGGNSRGAGRDEEGVGSER